MNIDGLDIPIDQLFYYNLISVKTLNIFRLAEIHTLVEIINYKSKYGSFENIRGCGTKCLIEINYLFENYHDLLLKYNKVPVNASICQSLNNDIKSTQLNSILLIFNDLDDFKKSIVENFIVFNTLHLSPKSQKAIQVISEFSVPKEIINTIFTFNFEFEKIRHVSDSGIEELYSFKQSIADYIEYVNAITNELLVKECFQIKLSKHFPGLENSFFNHLYSVFDNNGSIKFFLLLKLLIDYGQILNSKQKTIFENICFYNIPEYASSELIAKKLSVTKERVRQLKEKGKQRLYKYFQFIKDFREDNIINYSINNQGLILAIDNEFVEHINKNEGVNFNLLFYGNIYKILLDKELVLIDLNSLKCFSNAKKNYQNIKYCLLIPPYLLNYFKVKDFVQAIYNVFSSPIDKTYSINFNNYVHSFLEPDGINHLEDIKDVCNLILSKGFNANVNPDGYIICYKNTKKQFYEYLFEILEINNGVMKIDQISSSLNKIYPDLQFKTDKIRSSMQKRKDIFINFGRTSTWGLKIWEQEHSNIKGGTIRDIVEEYLQKYDSPKHISDISNYVNLYRNTKGSNIITNLKLCVIPRFQFFQDNYIGLISKNYADTSIANNSKNASSIQTKLWDII